MISGESAEKSGRKRKRIVLDTNEFVFGLTGHSASSTRLLDIVPTLAGWRIIISSTVLEETTRNLSAIHSSLVGKLHALIYGSRRFVVLSDDELPQSLVESYQDRGLPDEADARIGAFAEWVQADFLVSENRHFLRELKTTAYRVVDAAGMLAVLESELTC